MSVIIALMAATGLIAIATPAGANGPGIKQYACVDKPGGGKTFGIAAGDYQHDVYGVSWAVNAPHKAFYTNIPSCGLGNPAYPFNTAVSTEIAVYRWSFETSWALCSYKFIPGDGGGGLSSLSPETRGGICKQFNYTPGATWIFVRAVYWDGYSQGREYAFDWKSATFN
jgi:hypothetical protein